MDYFADSVENVWFWLNSLSFFTDDYQFNSIYKTASIKSGELIITLDEQQNTKKFDDSAYIKNKNTCKSIEA